MLTSIITWFTSNSKLLIISLLIILASIICYQYKQIQEQNIQINRLSDNVEYYQEELTTEKDNSRILQLTVDEYKTSKDSLIEEIRLTQKELKIKDKQLNQVQQQHQAIYIDTTIVVKSNDFVKEIKPNNLTSLIIIKKDSLLTAKLDIRNSQTLFLKHTKEYRNKYKNFFRRLIRFDFKKKDVFRYQIHNSNPIIKIEESRFIEIQ